MILFFCKSTYGHTFNLCMENNQTLKLWSFIGEVPVKSTKVQYKWEKTNDSYTVVGIEVTDEGDLNFYALQTIGSNEKLIANRAHKLIDCYVESLTEYYNN